MTTLPNCTTLYCDDHIDGAWDGETARISLYGRTAEGPALVGQVVLTRHTIMHLLTASSKAINGAYKQPKAKVIKFRPALHTVKGA